MPRNGSGSYTLPTPYNPVVAGTIIESLWANTTLEDVAAALTDSVSASGQTTPTANLPMGGYHHTGVSEPTLRNQYITLGMVQDGRQSLITITGGVNNITGTLPGNMVGVSSYTAGMPFGFFAPATCTGPMTLAINGVGAASLVSNTQGALVDGDVVAGNFYFGNFNGASFQLVNDVTSTAVVGSQDATTGWARPASDTYPTLSIASSTTVNVPAGAGTITPASNSGTPIGISWAAQTITLSYVASDYSTTITVDTTGTINQFPGRLDKALTRTQIVLGVVEHTSGSATNIVTKPAIYGDDGYLMKDLTSVVSNIVIAGAQVTRGGAGALLLDISAGQIASGGAAPNTINLPNVLPIAQTSSFAFRALAGQSTLGSSITTVPVGSYDPNGAGTVTALTGTDAAIHRLYYLYGQFIFAYGQTSYASITVALANILLDRGSYKPSLKLNDATLIAELIIAKGTTDLSNAYIINRGTFDYSIGASGGIADAPADSQTYGRNNNAWTVVSGGGGGSDFTTDVTITKANPRTETIMDPVGAGWGGLQNQQDAGFDWWNVEGTYPDDKVYFRSYNPATGTLRNTTTWNLATGAWTFGAVTVTTLTSTTINNSGTTTTGTLAATTANISGTATVGTLAATTANISGTATIGTVVATTSTTTNATITNLTITNAPSLPAGTTIGGVTPVSSTRLESGAISGVSLYAWTGLPAGVNSFTLVMYNITPTSGAGTRFIIQLGHGSTTYVTSGYAGETSSSSGTTAIFTGKTCNIGDTQNGTLIFTRVYADVWSVAISVYADTTLAYGTYTVTLPADLSAVKLFTSNATSMDGRAVLTYSVG